MFSTITSTSTNRGARLFGLPPVVADAAIPAALLGEAMVLLALAEGRRTGRNRVVLAFGTALRAKENFAVGRGNQLPNIRHVHRRKLPVAQFFKALRHFVDRTGADHVSLGSDDDFVKMTEGFRSRLQEGRGAGCFCRLGGGPRDHQTVDDRYRR